jgi:hypothetical protein
MMQLQRFALRQGPARIQKCKRLQILQDNSFLRYQNEVVLGVGRSYVDTRDVKSDAVVSDGS